MRRPETRPTFDVDVHGERVAGLAVGIDRAHLRRLQRGEWPVDSELDIHQMDRRRAQAAVCSALLEAHAEGERCMLVIHGRGIHSEGGPVLKEAVPGWLQKPPLAGLVMAFSTAGPGDGGTGATYVLLRRKRGV